MKNKRVLSIFFAVGIFALTLLLDLLTKELIISKLIPTTGSSVDVMPGFINFIYVKNKGAAWGMLAGRPVFLIVISLIVLALLVAFYILRIKKTGKKSSVLLGISMGLIVGGCIGNLVDRIAFGFVRDFINFEFMNFPVFNFADVALTVGVVVIIIYFVFYFSKEEKLLKNDLQETISFSEKADDSVAPDSQETTVEENRDLDGEENEG